MGKSGHIARKVASTLASTGTPAYFVHPAEASHGDLGMIENGDVFIAISYSGASDELVQIVPLIKRRGAKLIAITGKADSALAREADVHLDAGGRAGSLPAQPGADREHHRGARARRRARRGAARHARLSRPTTSRARTRGVPGAGAPGALHVEDVMRTGERVPQGRPARRSGRRWSRCRAAGIGMTAVLDPAGLVKGIFTDGDLRRTHREGADLNGLHRGRRHDEEPAHHPVPHARAEAVHVMEEHKVNQVLVVDERARWWARSTCTTSSAPG